MSGFPSENGRTETTRVCIALAYVNDKHLELIQWVGDTPGLNKEALDKRSHSARHIALIDGAARSRYFD